MSDDNNPFIPDIIEDKLKKHRSPSEFEDNRTTGERAADWFARFVGSWKFIFLYMGFTLLWTSINTLTPFKWDPYSFIFYTFCVSVLAILMSSLILLAGNRQADIDRSHAENAYHHVDEVNEKQDKQIRMLLEQNERMERQHVEMLEALKQLKENDEKNGSLHRF